MKNHLEIDARGWKLVAAAQAGDELAFNELWVRYRPQVRRFISSKVRDRDVADDLTSETFVRAWRSLGSAQDRGGDFGSWLFRIAHNLVIDHARAVARSRLIYFAEPTEPLVERQVPTEVGPDGHVLERTNQIGISVHLSRYVDRLSTRERRCLHLRFGGELTAAETGAAMGCSATAAKSLQYRAIRQLTALLAADGFSSSTQFAAASPDPWSTIPLPRRTSEPELREVA